MSHATPSFEDPPMTTLRFAPPSAPVVTLDRADALRRVSASTAEATRRLYGLRAMRFGVDGIGWRFAWTPRPSLRGPDPADWTIRLRIGRVAFDVAMDEAGPFQRTLDDLANLPMELRVAFVTGSGAALWRALETFVRTSVDVMSIAHGRAERARGDGVGFELGRLDAGPVLRGFVSDLDDAGARWLASASRQATTPGPVPHDVPIRLACVVGTTRVSTADLRGLRVHDTLLIEDAECATDTLQCWLAAGLGRRRIGRVRMTKTGLQMVQSNDRESAAMGISHDGTGPASPDEAGHDEIEVVLHFELARWRAPLSALSGFVAGAVVETGGRLDEPVVKVWSGDRCIGQGELVAVGDRLGVRLTSAFGRAADEGAAPEEEATAAPPVPSSIPASRHEHAR